MSRSLRLVAFVFVFVLLAQPAYASQFRLPVDGPVTDAYRPPSTPYGAGNRGWEFASTPGAAVVAVANGTVRFAGAVGGTLNVVVEHDGGLLTTYSKLASIVVHPGEEVDGGQSLGSAAEDTYFGIRIDGEYVDPASFFSGRAYLVGGPSAPAEDSTRTEGPPSNDQLSGPELAWLGTNDSSTQRLQSLLVTLHL